MPAREDVPEVIRRYFHGVNNEDWDNFRGIWHEDAVVDVVDGRLRVEGIEEIMEYYPRVLAGFPVHNDDPYAVHVAGDTVTVEIAFRGETEEGIPASFEALDVFSLDDGRIRTLATWYDMSVVVGLLREPGAPERRLPLLVGHCAVASPFYRRRFDELGLDPGRVAADLSRLPSTRPGEVELEGLVAVPDAEVRLLIAPGDVFPAVPLAAEDIRELTAQWATALELANVGPGDAVAAELPAPGLGRAAEKAGVRLVVVDPARPGPVAGTSVVFRRADAVAAATDARVVDVLAHPETGIIASGCTERALHVHTASQIVELDCDVLMVTPLGRRALPLLRWVTGDAATWDEEPCPCGSELPKLAGA